MESVMFAVFATLLVAASLKVVLAQSPLRSALALIVAQVALAGLYVLLQAPFVAAMQILLYAGAVLVLFVFVIMLLNLRGEDRLPLRYLAISKVAGALSVGAIVVRMVQLALQVPMATSRVDGSVFHVGQLLLGRYVFAFESISLMLLTAVISAVVLGLRRLS